MRKIIFFSFFLFGCSLCNGQSWLWGRVAKSQNPNAWGVINSDHSVAVDKAGNTYIAGSFNDTLSFGPDTVKSGNYYGIYLVKYDVSGNVLWARQAGENGSINNGGPVSIALDGAGNAYITGFFSNSIYFGADTLKENNYSPNWDMYIAKYDANGNILWAKQAVNANNTSLTVGISIAIDISGNAYVTGTFYGIVSFGNDSLKDVQDWKTHLGWWSLEDVFLVKYDVSGNVVWARQANSPSIFSNGTGNSVAVDKDGNVYITGTLNDTLSFGAYTLTSSEGGFLVKYDFNGNVLWGRQARPASSSSFLEGISAAVDGSGGVYITGIFSDTVYFDTDTLKEESTDGDVFLTKYNASGNMMWAKEAYILDSSSYLGCTVVCDTLKRGGGYLLIANNGGYANPPYKLKFGGETFSSNGRLAASVLLQFDSIGNTLCGIMFNAYNQQESMGSDKSGQYIYLVGDIDTTTIFGADTLTQFGYQWMPFIARWQPCFNTSNSISELKTNETINVFPNPFHNATSVVVNTDGKHYLEVYDLTGRKLEAVEFSGKQYELSSQGLARGMYFIRVLDNANALIGTSKIVVE